MSLDKAVEHGKEHRRKYHGAKAVDFTCRNHGSCEWCYGNRQYASRKKEEAAESRLKEYMDGAMTYAELLNKFLDICPVEVRDYRPFGNNAICIWTIDEKIIKVTFLNDDEFRVERITVEDWSNYVLGE